MSRKEDFPRLSPEVARRIAGDVTGFALEFWDADTARRRPLEWISAPGLVERFVGAAGLAEASARIAITALRQRAFVRTGDGRIYRFELVRVRPDAPGLVILAGGSAVCARHLHGVVKEAYELTEYDPRREAARLFAPEGEPDERAGRSQRSLDRLASGLTTEVQGTPWTLLVWDDDDDQDFVRWYLEHYPNTSDLRASDLATLVEALQLMVQNGRSMQQILFSTHGVEAAFDIGPETDPFNGPTVVGLYPGQTTPQQFMEAVTPYLAPGATITLLSCLVAGMTTDGGVTYDGRTVLRQIAEYAGGFYTLGSDNEVYLTNDQGQVGPNTAGRVMLATPELPRPITYMPPQGDNLMPLDQFMPLS